MDRHLPKILIHCGHTICYTCVGRFHKDARVRCPMCLKLIRNIETVDKLPTNHTIYAKLAEELRKKGEPVKNKIGLPPKKSKHEAPPPPVQPEAEEDEDGIPLKGKLHFSHQSTLQK